MRWLLILPRQLREILNKLENIMANQADLDTNITELGTALQAFKDSQTAKLTDLQTKLDDALKAGAPVDLTAEVASLQADIDGLSIAPAAAPETPAA